MRKFIFGVACMVMSILASPATAQQDVWVQIEAQRSLGRAQDVARDYSRSLQNISGFALRSGWYAIAIGPFNPADAEDIMRQLRITRQIPGDSYVVDGSDFRRQFWPVGAVLGTAPTLTPEPDASEVQPAVVRPLIPAEETVAQARQSERQLSREERQMLQTALQWEGFYTAAIDGAFGPGTRNSMAAWQVQEGYEATGILTTKQRFDLLARYTDVLTSLGIAPHTDQATGIQIDLPTALVKFDRYEPPFAHFSPSGDQAVQVLLISQTGDEATLRGLYDIMQTLEIVPLDGARNFGRRDFTLTGQNSDISSYTYAALAEGQVKGFTLIWPGEPDRKRAMVINAMKASFAPFPDAVLPDVYGDPNAAQSLDLLAGLNIRQPDSAGSGFYVDGSGAILTTAASVSVCNRVTVNNDFDAEIVALDTDLGLALLRPANALAPIAVAQLLTDTPRVNAEIAVSGYPYGGLLGAPTLTYGTLSDLRGLDGDRRLNRLSLTSTPSDAGGPILSTNGAVLGVLLPAKSGAAQRLPDDVKFAIATDALVGFLSANGVTPVALAAGPGIHPEDLSTLAADMTVLVSCWN